MAQANKFPPEKREEIIRKWVRATPAERRALSLEYGFDDSLPGYWRRKGYFPKDLTVPQPAKPSAVTSALVVVPRDVTGAPYTAEERVAIKAELVTAQGQGLAAVKAFWEKWGGQGSPVHSFVYDSVEKIMSTRTMPSEDFKRTAVLKIEEIQRQQPGRPLKQIVDEVIKGLGRSLHWTTYYAWRKSYGKHAPQAPAPAPAAKATNRGGRPRAGGPPTGLSEEEKLARVAQVDALRAAGENVADAVRKVGVSLASYQYWRTGRGLGRGPGRPRGSSEAMIVAANRALHKTNGAAPTMGSPVVPLIQEFFRRVKAMGAEIREMKTHDNGEMTVVVTHTETIKL